MAHNDQLQVAAIYLSVSNDVRGVKSYDERDAFIASRANLVQWARPALCHSKVKHDQLTATAELVTAEYMGSVEDELAKMKKMKRHLELF